MNEDVFSALSTIGKGVQDPFEQLSKMAGAPSESARKLAQKGKLTSQDLLKLFAIDEESPGQQTHAHISADAFKAVLAQLLLSRRIDTHDVTTTLFEMMDAGMLANKDVSRILRDLRLLKGGAGP